MQFTCAIEIYGRIMVVRGQGYLDDVGGEELKRVFANSSISELNGIVIDLSQCIHANSSGISCLVDLVIALGDEKQLEVAVCGLSPLLAETFRMVGLTKLTRIFSSIDEAVRGLLE